MPDHQIAVVVSEEVISNRHRCCTSSRKSVSSSGLDNAWSSSFWMLVGAQCVMM